MNTDKEKLLAEYRAAILLGGADIWYRGKSEEEKTVIREWVAQDIEIITEAFTPIFDAIRQQAILIVNWWNLPETQAAVSPLLEEARRNGMLE